ncbi:MAG: hypothetical protein ABFD62_03165 [Syntrophaceae bacterium]
MSQDDFIHLCQPDDRKSCGACCGLYNYADSSKKSLLERLRKRTGLFRKTVKGRADLPAFSEMVRNAEDNAKLYEVIYCCEFLGFIEGERKVGCLLHPMQNGGADLRDVSFYGRELCDGHFCPSYHYISPAEKKALLNIIDDWYLFGLCVTDIDLVKEYFRLISEALGEMPHPDSFLKPGLKESALRFFELKTSWPFRSRAANRFGKYYFEGTQYMIHFIDYEALGCERSRYNAIFLSLASEFANAAEVAGAEGLIEKHINDFTALYGMPAG